MSIADECSEIAAGLAPLLDTSSDAVEAAIALVYQRPSAERRNKISVLATADHFRALLAGMTGEDRRAALSADHQGHTRRDRALSGELDRVAVAVCDEVAGRFDVAWDGNWPSARARLRGRIPEHAREGDTIVGGDGGGTRIDITVLRDEDGTLTGEAVAGTWRDPPLEDVWLSTYRRLAELYPGEVPPLPGGPGGGRPSTAA